MALIIGIALAATIPAMIFWALFKAMGRWAVWGKKPATDIWGVWLLIGLTALALGGMIEWWAGVAVLGVGLAAVTTINKERERYEAAMLVIGEHARELATRRAQLLVVKPYGVVDRSQWDKEMDDFIGKVINPKVGAFDLFSPVYAKVSDAIEQEACSFPLKVDFRDDINPIEYEQLVAETLRTSGWKAHTTKASGDQGADVIAAKDGVVVVLQCKLYSKPVGNAAVQEAIAGMAFHKANNAAVVSNAAFTRQARELASASGVVLLHHEQLTDLDQLVGRGQTQALAIK